jgi:hypothetical protein
MSNFDDDFLVFTVDFNNVDSGEGRFVIASRTAVSSFRVPRVGEEVWLRDPDGDECPGMISEIRERTVIIQPDWDRMLPAEECR